MSDLDRIHKALTYGQPILVLPADQPDYETLTDLTMEQKAALPARFHTPSWMNAMPGAFVCRVCWEEGVVTGWPCKTAEKNGRDVFGPEVPVSRDRSEPTPAPREPRVWREGDPAPTDASRFRDDEDDEWTIHFIGQDGQPWLHMADTPSFPWSGVLKMCRQLTEVLPEVVTPEDPA